MLFSGLENGQAKFPNNVAELGVTYKQSNCIMEHSTECLMKGNKRRATNLEISNFINIHNSSRPIFGAKNFIIRTVSRSS